ncbi:hypothetical protein [Rubellicoccus peritrichatus]|uniref:Uncharacterized protein n=1 Tax=Rubellicoccus peritrichatus TaxID=3080537 RepID=A0AAQ3LD91_9BACT|nr:hypothetical protein [Puniceicoccus sp. CR14]WOO42382.1 hypothetical protein RZN69_04720 [Puniceicoccus sp. CR14]
MSFPQRLFIFCIGALIGTILVVYIMKKRGLEKPEGPPETLEQAEIQAVPGILKAYDERRMPLDSPYIVGSFRQPGKNPGEYRRVAVLRGRLPGQLLRVVEIQKSLPNGMIELLKWRVMAADRVVAQLNPGTKPSELTSKLGEWGYRLLKKASESDAYVIQLDNSEPEAVDLAIKRIEGLGSPVVSVRPDYLDSHNTDL